MTTSKDIEVIVAELLASECWLDHEGRRFLSVVDVARLLAEARRERDEARLQGGDTWDRGYRKGLNDAPGWDGSNVEREFKRLEAERDAALSALRSASAMSDAHAEELQDALARVRELKYWAEHAIRPEEINTRDSRIAALEAEGAENARLREAFERVWAERELPGKDYECKEHFDDFLDLRNALAGKAGE